MYRVQEHEFIDLAPRPTPRPSLDRRGFLRAATALAATTAMAPEAFARNFEQGAEPTRYPDPDIVVLDKRFRYRLGNTPILRLYTGTMWAEGPAWNGVGRYLLWSDIPNDEQLRYLEEDGHVSRRFRAPSGNSNGNTFDYQGRQIAFEHGNRRVVRYEYNGKITVLADNADGKPFNAPNDGVVHPNDGSIWFTDPGYGALMDYEGHRVAEASGGPATGATASGAPGPSRTPSVQPFMKEAIYRIDAQSGKITKVADEPFKPNGMCFSHDYTKMFVADTGITHYPNAKNIIWVYDIDGDKLKNPRTFADMDMGGKSGFPDGIRADEDGNIWAAVGWVGDGYDGVHVFEPGGGQRIGLIRMPEICANLAFGGSKRNRLFMTGSQSLYAVYVETRGAHIT